MISHQKSKIICLTSAITCEWIQMTFITHTKGDIAMVTMTMFSLWTTSDISISPVRFPYVSNTPWSLEWSGHPNVLTGWLPKCIGDHQPIWVVFIAQRYYFMTTFSLIYTYQCTSKSNVTKWAMGSLALPIYPNMWSSFGTAADICWKKICRYDLTLRAKSRFLNI